MYNFTQIVRKFEGEEESIHFNSITSNQRKKNIHNPLTGIWLTNSSCYKFTF